MSRYRDVKLMALKSQQKAPAPMGRAKPDRSWTVACSGLDEGYRKTLMPFQVSIFKIIMITSTRETMRRVYYQTDMRYSYNPPQVNKNVNSVVRGGLSRYWLVWLHSRLSEPFVNTPALSARKLSQAREKSSDMHTLRMMGGPIDAHCNVLDCLLLNSI